THTHIRSQIFTKQQKKHAYSSPTEFEKENTCASIKRCNKIDKKLNKLQ
ncbi:hypothetical protein DOY81_001209, partial [Sarcophaga bullata]